MTDFSTPMMKQYREIKNRYKDCLLFYRMGDFYELFMDDAYIGAHVLNITLTSKAGGKDGKIPMAGIPYHAVDSYLAKLVKAGYKVAICEQLSPPNKKGLVERDVVRIVTPGTLLDEKALSEKANNYIVSITRSEAAIGFAVADLSTGFFATEEFTGTEKEQLLQDELARLAPTECILSDSDYNDNTFLSFLTSFSDMNLYAFPTWDTYTQNAQKFLEEHFHLSSLAAFGIEGKNLSQKASAALLGYLQETQLSRVGHIQKIQYLQAHASMLLDRSTMINLELFATIRDKEMHGSLLEVLDKTQTAMGGRLLRQWMKKPLLEKNAIGERHSAVEELVKNTRLRKNIDEKLQRVTDIERILSRLSVNIGNARDVINMKNSLQEITHLSHILDKTTSPLFKSMGKNISGNIKKIIALVEKTFIDEPPIELREGNLIKMGVDKKLDNLRKIIHTSQRSIKKMEEAEKKKTGISSLKVRYNQVFGFYIEVSRTNAHLVPKDYLRKQTLVNGERFITPQLKKQEEIILSAQEESFALEYDVFQQTLQKILVYTTDIQNAALSVASLDCITSFAKVSEENRYIRPKLLYSGEIKITQGRHPVVEKLLGSDTPFVPNDVTLDNINQSLLILTGPNMAGKSVLIRQVALTVFLNQIGCFVPAKKAYLSLVDRIFVRSGASDAITSGLSTFMVEMVETAYILQNATGKSLIVMDEIGRGTSTYDGISIAHSVAAYIVSHFTPIPKTLFATHYHELQSLEKEYSGKIKNYHMSVADDNGQPIFLHTLLPGGASHSFGIAVASLAGVPQEVIENAKTLLHQLEERSSQQQTPPSMQPEKTNLTNTPLALHIIQKELEHIDIATLTPLEALNKLAQIKEQIRLLQAHPSMQDVD